LFFFLIKRYNVPKEFYFEECRRLFKEPLVVNPDEVSFKFEKPDEEGLKKFLVEDKGFSETRVTNGLTKIKVNKFYFYFNN
jgi:flap endonuclease-1